MQRPITPDAVRRELASILATPAFRNSPLRSRFLTYVVDCALVGDHENLKEYVIGVEVFSRPESFDPRLDSVVRVHATHLRKKLRAYYEVNGSNSHFRITIPPGSYRPVFEEADCDPGIDSDVPPDVTNLGSGPGLLVLPCADLDGGGRCSFAKALTEEMLVSLSELQFIRIVPGMAETRDALQSLIRHASRARATTILDSAVTCDRAKVRMTSKLISASTLHIIWLRQFETEAGDALGAQQLLAGTLAAEVAAQLQHEAIAP